MRVPALAVALRCPRCGEDGEGSADDAMLVCVGCAEAREVSGGGPVLPVVHVAPVGSETGPAFALYRYPALRVAASGPEEGVRRLREIGCGWVAASRVRRFQVYGDVGLEYTRRPPRLQAGPPGVRALGVSRSPGDAALVLRILLLRIASEGEAEGPRTVEVDPGPPELWLVPTIVDGSHVKLPHCPVRYPASLVEGWRRVSE